MQTGNKFFVIGLLLFCIANSAFQCNKRIGCGDTVHNFEMGIKAYPDNEVIRIGDTIWLEVNEPSTLKDFETGREINFSNAANLGSVISFHQLSNDKEFTIKAAEKFAYILKDGTKSRSIDPLFERAFEFDEKDRNYIFKLGIVPKEVGMFRLFFSNATNVYRKDDKCSKSNFILNFKETNQHYYLSPTYQGGNLVGGDYYFKVE